MSLRIRLAAPDAAVTPEFIEAGMEAATVANGELLRQGLAPSATELLRRGAKWKPERFGDGEHFDTLDTIAGRGWGDCDDWASGLAAEYRVTGQDPGARAIVRRSGDRRWHALTQLSDGSIVDPSSWAGMPSRLPLTARRFAIGEAGAIISPNGRRGWFARCDMPVGPGHVVGVGWGCCSPQRALAQAVGAACGAHERGEEIAGRVGEWVVGFDLGDVGAYAGGVAGGALGGPAGAAAGAYLGGQLGSEVEAQAGSGNTHGLPSDYDPLIKAIQTELLRLTAFGGIGSGEAPGPELDAKVASLKQQLADAIAKKKAAQDAFDMGATPPAPTQQPTQSAPMAGGGQIQWGPCAPIIIRFQ